MGAATCSCGGRGQRLIKGAIESFITATTGQQQAFGLGQVLRAGSGTQGQNTLYDAPSFDIYGDKAFGVQFAEGNVERPPIWFELLQTVPSQIDAFPDADAGEAGEEEGIRKQLVGTTQFLLQPLIVFKRKRLRQILVWRREVLAANQFRLDRLTEGGQILQ